MEPLTLARVLLSCWRCSYKATVDWPAELAAIATAEITCPNAGCRSGSVLLRRMVWRRSRPSDTSCRSSEAKPSVPLPPPDTSGLCSWECRGSLSPICRCPCHGEHHGTVHRLTGAGARAVLTFAAEADAAIRKLAEAVTAEPSPEELYEQIEASHPRGDWPGRKST